MDYSKRALEAHKRWGGKIEVISKAKIKNKDDLSIAYTPGVAAPCMEITKDPDLSYVYTRRRNLVAVITDGSAVLGLGNIGAVAGMPVMEGKCALFKEFGGVDAIPIVIDSQDTEEIIKTIKNIAGSFGGINLEDIAAPKCFEIERRLIEELDIPVFHDDQHGTAIVVLAALINALKVVKKEMKDIKIALSGPGAAGAAITRLLIEVGVKDIILVDKKGIIYRGKSGLDFSKQQLAAITNKDNIQGELKDAIKGADVFIGVSAANIVSQDMIRSMNADPIVFAMANPIPEIMPDLAIQAGAAVVGTGRSDFANQINNVLAFPAIFKGALAVRARQISKGMKIAAAYALAELIDEKDLRADYIIPDAFDKRVCEYVSRAVAEQAIKEGLNRI
ncbi:MAG TPA: NADP-dependent malic enzyme [Clostridiales bacterium]|nr:NADP-dependent malic enzyme [Clostridiales bacterium]